jgi:hypothetical protein
MEDEPGRCATFTSRWREASFMTDQLRRTRYCLRVADENLSDEYEDHEANCMHRQTCEA